MNDFLDSHQGPWSLHLGPSSRTAGQSANAKTPLPPDSLIRKRSVPGRLHHEYRVERLRREPNEVIAQPQGPAGDLPQIPKVGILVPRMGIEEMLSSPGDALYPRTRQAVLRLFFTHPDRRFLQKEVIAQLGLGSGAVQRELDRLWRAHILERSVDGRQTYFQANAASPIFKELRGLVRKTFGVAHVLGEALQPIAHRIELAFVFGSVAKGTDKSASDVDLLVVSDGLTLSDLIPAIRPTEEELGREVNPSLYSTKEFRRKLAEGHNFLTSVVEGPKTFLIGGESELRRLAEIRLAESPQNQPRRDRRTRRHR